MEVCKESTNSNGKQTLKHSKSADEVKRSSENTYRCFHSNGKQNLKQTSMFVNHAANAWHENRKKWVGDKSQQSPRTPKDPIISSQGKMSLVTRSSAESFQGKGSLVTRSSAESWSTSYEDLLSTNEPFAERIPLPEMVDFLVDIWLDEEGTFD
jgi:transposase